MSRTIIYVGNLPNSISESGLEQLFGIFGNILSISIKGGSNKIHPKYAFIEFSYIEDATDAIDNMDKSIINDDQGDSIITVKYSSSSYKEK